MRETFGNDSFVSVSFFVFLEDTFFQTTSNFSNSEHCLLLFLCGTRWCFQESLTYPIFICPLGIERCDHYVPMSTDCFWHVLRGDNDASGQIHAQKKDPASPDEKKCRSRQRLPPRPTDFSTHFHSTSSCNKDSIMSLLAILLTVTT